MVVSNGWLLHQLNVDNAFLNDGLREEVYMAQSLGFVNKIHSDKVWQLHKTIYELQHSPRTWYEKLHGFLNTIGFVSSTSDHSLFIYKYYKVMVFILVYIDNIIVTAP